MARGPSGAARTMSAGQDVRPSPIAGQWYPGDPARLAASVDGYLASAHAVLARPVVALVVPHAGHRYSGGVAAHAFALVRGLAPEIVAVIGPMHAPAPGTLLTSSHQGYATPLGVVPVGHDLLRALDGDLRAEVDAGLTEVRSDEEHSVEIELPFLQRALGAPFRLVPVMVRDRRAAVLRGLGRALARRLAGRSALLVASTDLSHHYPQRTARALDSEILARIEALDPDGVLRAEAEGRAYACGSGALAAVLWAARDLGADSAHILSYATSGDVTGDLARVVGYAAAAITRA